MNARRHNPERGAALVITMAVLIALTMAGLAAMYAARTDIQIAANAAYQKEGLSATDSLLGYALRDLATVADFNSASSPFYYPSYQDADNKQRKIRELSDGATRKKVDLTVNGQTLPGCYIIERLCALAGPPNTTANPCAIANTDGASRSSNNPLAQQGGQGLGQVYYRITLMADASRSSQAISQVIVAR